MITLAVAKGRILKETLQLLARHKIFPESNPSDSRKLVLATSHPHLRLLVVRTSDVPTYVHHGVADLGIVGKDTLLEYAGSHLYELIDLGIAKCRMIVAAQESFHMASVGHENSRPFRVASKYPRIAENFFACKGLQIELIKLYGSMELAPILGLSDVIVDIVDTGSTLKANHLVEIDHIADISTRLIANKASRKIKRDEIDFVLSCFKEI